jgi:hypothetical protein
MNAQATLVALVLVCAAPATAQQTVDLSVVNRIEFEAFQNGKVMDHLFYLTDVGGPRLTASPGQRAAADWAIARLKSWGISSARSERWGRFGRSWQLKRFDAHLDSWHAGTGATDNAAGCAVVLEAMRILKTLALPLERTVRLALWTGEEQVLYGSRAYLKSHFADPLTMKLLPDHARLAGYFNVDNGTGKIRGVHLQGNDMVRPVFEAWLAPFADLGARTLTARDTEGTTRREPTTRSSTSTTTCRART